MGGGDFLLRFLLPQPHCLEKAAPEWLGHILNSEIHP